MKCIVKIASVFYLIFLLCLILWTTRTPGYYYEQDGIVYRLPRKYSHICCDCGLVHTVVWKPKSKGIVSSWSRNELATKKRRTEKNIAITHYANSLFVISDTNEIPTIRLVDANSSGHAEESGL